MEEFSVSARESILEILAVLPSSQAALAERAKIRLATVCDWLAVMMAKHEVHICNWAVQPRGGKPIAIYKAGAGISAPRPIQSINAVRVKASRTRRTLQ